MLDVCVLMSGIEVAKKLCLRGCRRGGLGDPQGVEGIGAGIGTSVIREAVTDAYGASTLWVPHGWNTYDYLNAQMHHS